VRVKRDRWGVAHSYARNRTIFSVRGLCRAQDRLFRWRSGSVGTGTIAEVIGPEALARDLNARRLRYRGDMEASSKIRAGCETPSSRRSRLESTTHRGDREAGGRGPVEFQIACLQQRQDEEAA